MNKHLLIGRLGKAPDLRTTSQGTSVCTFSLATTHKNKDLEETDWHNIIVFGNMADACAKYLDKGSQVFVEGRSTKNEYEDKDGSIKNYTNIIAQKVEFL